MSIKDITGSKAYIKIEFLILCILMPTTIIVFVLAPYMFAFLWGAALYGCFIYQKHYFKNIKTLWNWSAVKWDILKPILIRWIICSVLMLGFIYFYDPEKMFGIIKYNPEIVPALLIMYPILSALPQEFIFCSFFFERYKSLFKTERSMIIASTIVFAYAHVLFINIVAPVLSLIAGYIFATTFAKHRSLALVTIEHGLYGNSLFLVGLGWYFYGGAVGMH